MPSISDSLDQLGHLSKVELAHLLYSKPRLLHGVGDGHSLEVSTVMNLVACDVNEGVVGRRVELNLEGGMRRDEVRDERADPLSGGAKGVAILAKDALVLLHAELLLRMHGKRRARKDGTNVASGLDLTRVRSSDIVDEAVVSRESVSDNQRGSREVRAYGWKEPT